MLTMMVGANISPEQLLSIADRTIQEADIDRDHLISFQVPVVIRVFRNILDIFILLSLLYITGVCHGAGEN